MSAQQAPTPQQPPAGQAGQPGQAPPAPAAGQPGQPGQPGQQPPTQQPNDSQVNLIQRLLKQTQFRECYTMADVIAPAAAPGAAGQDEDPDVLEAIRHLADWDTHPLLKPWRQGRGVLRHTAQHDTISGIQELSARVLEARRPKAVGRSLVNIMETTRPSVQFRVEDETGEAADTNRGGVTTSSYSVRNKWVTVKCDKEIEVSDSWDLNFLEDAEWNVNMSHAAAMGKNIMTRETTKILNKYKEITDADSAGKIVQAGNLAADNLTDAWSLIDQEDAEADTIVMHGKRFGQLLKDPDFKDSRLLGEFVNYRNGMFGNYLGMQIYKTNLMPKDDVYVFDSSRVLFMGLRRDRLMLPLNEARKYGLQISTRYGLEFGDKKSFATIKAA